MSLRVNAGLLIKKKSICEHIFVCAFGFSVTYVPAEYLEEYKASLEQAADDIFTETAQE